MPLLFRKGSEHTCGECNTQIPEEVKRIVWEADHSRDEHFHTGCYLPHAVHLAEVLKEILDSLIIEVDWRPNIGGRKISDA